MLISIKILMGMIKAFVFSVVNRIFKIFGWHAVFVNTSGVKCINQSLNSDYLRSLKVIEEIELNPVNLYLGFDGLKDDFTLLDSSVKDSPHFEFLNNLFHNKGYRKSDYFNRFVGGKLDLRCNQWPVLYNFYTLFKLKKELIETGQNPPVLVTKINEKYYILDGKHNAALSIVLNKNVRCLLLETPYSHPFFKSLLKKMKTREEFFSKNIGFLNMAYAQ